MRRQWAWVAGAAVVALLLVVAIAQGWFGGGSTAAGPARAFSATTSLSTGTVSFGDPLTARLDLLVDPARIDPSAIEVSPRFGAWRLAKTSVVRTRGTGELVSYRFALECLIPACTPERSRVVRQFQTAVVSYRTRDGATVTQRVPWPSYQLLSRVTDHDRKSPATSLRYEAALPAPTYRVDPGTLRTLLTLLAGLLAVAAAALAWFALRPERSGVREPSVSRLEQALRAVRASSANGKPAERRKALGWLGRELRTVERPTEANEARRLAWSASAPTGQAAGDFAAEVETAEGAE